VAGLHRVHHQNVFHFLLLPSSAALFSRAFIN